MNEKFRELLEKRRKAEPPTIVKPKEIDLTTLSVGAIVLEAKQILLKRPEYRVLYCLEKDGKRLWKLILNESSTK